MQEAVANTSDLSALKAVCSSCVLVLVQRNTVAVHADYDALCTTLAWVVNLGLAALQLSVRENDQRGSLQVDKADAHHFGAAIVRKAHAGRRSTVRG